ncbi:MAG: TRIC cation channel family protein [Eggerthellaceae bacterium]|nr:TRIC cation channel family protein [Eggerthellaceae bacterium]
MDIGALFNSVAGQGQALTVPWGFDYFSIIVGAITGALYACERKLDTVGTVVAGLLTAYGGGLIRDVILQDEGIYFTEHPDLIVICVVLCVFVFYFRGLFKNLDKAIMLADTLSVALFALAGVNKAYAAGSGIVVSIVLGAITAVGGGALRDISMREVPMVFKRSNYYAVAGLGGSVVFVALARVGCPLPVAAVLCVATVVGLRYASVELGIKTKQEADLSPKVIGAVNRLRGKGAPDGGARFCPSDRPSSHGDAAGGQPEQGGMRSDEDASGEGGPEKR